MTLLSKEYRIIPKENGFIVQTKQITPVTRHNHEWHTVENLIENNWFENILDFFGGLLGLNPIDAKTEDFIFKNEVEAQEFIKKDKERKIFTGNWH